MVTLSLIPSDFRLIDTSSIMEFSGADFTNPNHYLAYRDEIWTLLETMIDKDKLKTVHKVWSELEWMDSDSAIRLQPRKEKFILPKESDEDIGVANLIAKYPSLVDPNETYARDDADPYLILYAKKLSVQIITEERPLSLRTGHNKKKRLKIPDVCHFENMKSCICLKEFLKAQGIIPPEFH